ncbi:hypothetical protein [Gymnodinialimonas ceratoperidinii]|uniref:Phytanoyl-CoA dioxygenase PhyH n=1 Tax=Gymnodinialimonas ceratoperidinii TaxID=2856823 RepID=A0A8F6TTN9_9RHOB|nr:hypothetical protein [Gymnodinialimonas ceratoperidinii]QXT38293.1 hypothetical protein KYE46_10040 [Gymnodinialimonas ceratoperidinii]
MSWLCRGWQVFDSEPAVAAWVEAARVPALAAAAREPRRHGGTWCVGVDILDNDAEGRVTGGPPLRGAAFAEAALQTGVRQLHRAQVSVTHPGYPGRDPEESAANHRFRRDRDAAHLDGLLPVGPEKRRQLREPHAWILGIALNAASAQAAPLVVWDGSHEIIRRAFAQGFDGIAPHDWATRDVTETYRAARADVFERCERIEVPLRPGQSVLLHRMTIHGVAPWKAGADAPPEGRATAYFRPLVARPEDWLALS